jgi:hypothetical protein
VSAFSDLAARLKKPEPRPLVKKRQRTRIESKHKAIKRAVQVRDEGRCRVCKRAAESTHEIHSRGAGGKVSLENSIATCGDGTRGCHGKLQRYELLVIGHNANGKLLFRDNGRKK